MDYGKLAASTAQNAIVCAVLCLVVLFLTRVLRFDRTRPEIADPKRSVFRALVAVAVMMFSVTAYMAIRDLSGSSSRPPTSIADGFTASRALRHLLLTAITAGIPIAMALRLGREPLSSIGITKQNAIKSLAIVAVIGAVVLLGSGRGNFVDKLERLGVMSMGHLWAGLVCLCVGLAEEISFRGLLQTRMIAWLGPWRGLVLTSLLMALAHFGARMIDQNIGPVDALLSALSVLPPSLFFGFVMIRTRNVLAPVVLHAFMNWQVTLNG